MSHIEQAHNRPESPMITPPRRHPHVYRVHHMLGGVIVGDCCCVPVQCVTLIVRAQLLPIVCRFYRSAQGLILFLITCEHYLYLCIYSPFLLRLYLNIHKTRVFSSFLQLYDSIPGKLGLFVNLSWSTGILSILSGQQGISPSF